MNLKNALTAVAGTIVIAALMLLSAGCSDDGPNGPDSSPPPGETYDDITVSLSRLSVKYDCDFDPVGVTQPGDFWYSLNVDTLSDNGTDWLAITKFKEASAKISNGGYKDISGQSASFRFPRRNGQAFRVRMSLREADATGNDFSSKYNVAHIYSKASSQMYPPDGANYSSWSNATTTGTMSWNVNKRDRSWVAGILTVEGCNATLKYTVTVREVD